MVVPQGGEVCLNAIIGVSRLGDLLRDGLDTRIECHVGETRFRRCKYG